MDQWNCWRRSQDIDRTFFEPLVADDADDLVFAPPKLNLQENWPHVAFPAFLWILAMILDPLIGFILLLTMTPMYLLWRWFKKLYRPDREPKVPTMFKNFSWGFWFVAPVCRLCIFIVGIMLFNIILHKQIREWMDRIDEIENDPSLSDKDANQQTEEYIEDELYKLRTNPVFHIFLLSFSCISALLAEWGKYLQSTRSIRFYLSGVDLDKWSIDPIVFYATTIGLAYGVMENVLLAMFDFDAIDTLWVMLISIVLGSIQHAFCGYLIGLRQVEQQVLESDLRCYGIIKEAWFFDFVYSYCMWWMLVYIEGNILVTIFATTGVLIAFYFLGKLVSQKRQTLHAKIHAQTLDEEIQRSENNERNYNMASVYVPDAAADDNQEEELRGPQFDREPNTRFDVEDSSTKEGEDSTSATTSFGPTKDSEV